MPTHTPCPLLSFFIDLALVHNEDVQCLALMAIANVGGKQFSEALFPAVLNILTNRDTRPLLRKKAALTALRLFRKYPELLPPDEAWREKVLRLMTNYTDLGQMLCVSSFVLGYASKHPESFEDAVGHAIRCLHQVCFSHSLSLSLSAHSHLGTDCH